VVPRSQLSDHIEHAHGVDHWSPSTTGSLYAETAASRDSAAAMTSSWVVCGGSGNDVTSSSR